MLKSKKFLLLMALVLCFVCLTACSGDSNDNGDDSATVPSGNTENAQTGTPTNPNAGVGDAATADKVDPDDENAPQGLGKYTETAAVVTSVSGNTVSYDIYGYISDVSYAENDTITIKDRVFEKTEYYESFTAKDTSSISVTTYSSADDATVAAEFSDIQKGDTIIVLTEPETGALAGIVIFSEK